MKTTTQQIDADGLLELTPEQVIDFRRRFYEAEHGEPSAFTKGIETLEEASIRNHAAEAKMRVRVGKRI